MAAIYLRNGSELLSMSEQAYQAEDVLQTLVAEHPELLAGDDSATDAAWALVKREAAVPDADGATGRWSLDHLFLDASGVPTLVEVKRSSDTRARREVVAQMLDYAANATAFWKVERLQEWFEAEAAGQGLSGDEELERALGVTEPERYWETVRTNLAADRIRLVFVADEIAPELRAIVEFLNRRMTETEVLAIEVKQYVDSGGHRQILVPKLVGRTEAARITKGASGPVKRFDLANAPAEFHALVARMNELAPRLRVVSSRKTNGVSYDPPEREPGVSFWYGVGVYGTSRGMEMNLLPFRELGAHEVADELQERLGRLIGRPVAAKFPSISCAAVLADWDRFVREVIEPYFVARAELAATHRVS